MPLLLSESDIRALVNAIRAPIHAVASAEDAARGANVIALVSGATEPILRSEWVGDGAHVCAVGACRPTHREMHGALVARARLVVDSRAAALVEAGDIVMAIQEGRIGPDHILAELGEVLAGRAVGRTAPEQVTIFKSLGLAVEDVAAASLACRRARQRGLGQDVTL
jgi:ornithine cyclodeaminase